MPRREERARGLKEKGATFRIGLRVAPREEITRTRALTGPAHRHLGDRIHHRRRVLDRRTERGVPGPERLEEQAVPAVGVLNMVTRAGPVEGVDPEEAPPVRAVLAVVAEARVSVAERAAVDELENRAVPFLRGLEPEGPVAEPVVVPDAVPLIRGARAAIRVDEAGPRRTAELVG